MNLDLPYGVARPPGGEPRCVVRLCERAVDLSALDLPVAPGTFEAAALNPFLALGEQAWADVHGRLEELADPELPGWPLDEVFGVDDLNASDLRDRLKRAEDELHNAEEGSEERRVAVG